MLVWCVLVSVCVSVVCVSVVCVSVSVTKETHHRSLSPPEAAQNYSVQFIVETNSAPICHVPRKVRSAGSVYGSLFHSVP